MPNTLTHFLAAERVAERLGGTLFEPAINDRPEWLRIGAIFPDALFYLPEADPDADLKDLASPIHGEEGQDTFLILKGLAAAYPQAKAQNALLSFLVGLAGHILADATMHPLIFYLSGNMALVDGREKSLVTRAHRVLETTIDLYFLGGPQGLKRTLLHEYLARAQRDWTEMIGLISGIMGGDELKDRLGPALSRSFERFGRAERHFTNPAFARGMHLLRGLMPDSIKEVAALCYAPRLTGFFDRLSGELDYQDPVDGSSQRATLADLLEKAVARAADFCRRMEPYLESGRELPDEWIGPSLDSGRVGVPMKAMVHLAPEPIIKF